MNLPLFRALFLTLLCLSTVANTLYAEPLPDTIRIVTGDWVPYVSKEYPGNGPLAEIISDIYQRSNISVEFVYLPWADGYQAMVDGKFHATMPYYCTAKRMKESLCSEPLVAGEMVFFHRNDSNFDWSDFEDLKGLTLGFNYGYYYGDDLVRMEKQGDIMVKRSVRDDTSMMALMRQKLDLYPQDKSVGYTLIKKLFPVSEQKRITHHRKPLHTRTLHVLFSKKNTSSSDLVGILNAEITRRGILQKLSTSTQQTDTSSAN